jgi:integrase/recombinase XerD
MSGECSWRRYLPLAQWPSVDRNAWNEAVKQGDVLDGQGPAAHWAAATRRTNCQHYSRWLGFLANQGILEADVPPQDRVSKPVVRRYVDHLKSEIAPRTVVSSLVGLKVMMKAMAPQVDWRWLADVCNALNRNAKPKKIKGSRMRPTGDIYAAAIAELDRLLAMPLTRRIERVAYRDTLMLAMLAARPLRLKNFTNILIGQHLVRQGPTCLLVIPGEEVKNKQPLEYALPPGLDSYLKVYLERVRLSFGATVSERSLWLTFEGTPLDDHSINWRFMLVTKRLLGVAMNPHLLRDCAATSLSTESPAMARAAAAILGHRSFATTERYYVRANQLEASRTVNSTLSALKSTLK